jgi:lysophospholipase L1-like esterase
MPSVLLTIEKHIKPTNRYLALGDSYTIGESVHEADRWPEQWAGFMNESGQSIQQPVHIIAKTGWTTDELMHDIELAGELGVWQWLSLLIGVNNQYRGRSLENFNNEFKQLAEKAIILAGQKTERVFVLSIPDWGQTPFGMACGRDTKQISAEIDGFNEAVQNHCNQLGIDFIDITTITRQHSHNQVMHALDGLHPSAAMYQLWAKKLHAHIALHLE